MTQNQCKCNDAKNLKRIKMKLYPKHSKLSNENPITFLQTTVQLENPTCNGNYLTIMTAEKFWPWFSN